MNIFRLAADLMHLASIFILLLKITQTHSAAGALERFEPLISSGISFKTQALYLVVFVTRYLDLFTNFVSPYNTVMKIFFIASSTYILYLMWFKYKSTWDPALDTFRVEFLVPPCILLALVWNYERSVKEVLWAFSIYLEAVAVLPQLFQLTRTGEAESITVHYMFALGGYRALYLVNWIWRYFREGHIDPIVWVAGLVQTAIYSDFLYVYVTKYVISKRLTSILE
jgi:ER lumen protein retaining receptor